MYDLQSIQQTISQFKFSDFEYYLIEITKKSLQLIIECIFIILNITQDITGPLINKTLEEIQKQPLYKRTIENIEDWSPKKLFKDFVLVLICIFLFVKLILLLFERIIFHKYE
jgi:hypothetical protein